FTNGVEWLGVRLKLGQTATGTILAALGTALPEGVVTLVATAFADNPAQQLIGIGAAMGGPLALATIAYAVVGGALLANRRAPVLPARARRAGAGAGCRPPAGRPVRLAHRHRDARDPQCGDLGPAGQAKAGSGQYQRRDDDPGHHPHLLRCFLHPLDARPRPP